MRQNLVGQRFSRWTVIAPAEDRGYKSRWIVQCDCGQERTIQGSTLLEGTSRSCGCLKDEVAKRTSITHGMCRSREYHSWQTAKERCHNPNNTGYRLYGGRGIEMCSRWRESFQNFYADMGNRPIGTSLDRLNNDGHYSPENCRWATQKQQARNTRRNRMVTFNGVTLPVVDWATRVGISYRSLSHRIGRGWTPERALTQPAQVRHA